MKRLLKSIEMAVDKSVPYLVIILLFIIIVPFVAPEFAEHYEMLIHFLDYFIISIFVVDLIFKYFRVHKFTKFLRHYWLDIIAIFPFYLLFRVFEESFLLIRAGEQITETQPILHVAVGFEKEAPKLLREAEELSKLNRVRVLSKIARPIARAPRLLKAVAYYEEPKHKNDEFHKIIKSLT